MLLSFLICLSTGKLNLTHVKLHINKEIRLKKKAQLSFSDHFISVCVSVCKPLLYFTIYETTGAILTKLCTKHI